MILTPVSEMQMVPKVIILQKPRSEDAQYDHFRTQFHMKVPHDLNSQAKEYRLDCAAESLNDYPFGELIAC